MKTFMIRNVFLRYLAKSGWHTIHPPPGLFLPWKRDRMKPAPLALSSASELSACALGALRLPPPSPLMLRIPGPQKSRTGCRGPAGSCHFPELGQYQCKMLPLCLTLTKWGETQGRHNIEKKKDSCVWTLCEVKNLSVRPWLMS